MSEPASTDFLLGQITAQLRELVHSSNNMAMGMNGLEVGLGKRIDDLSNRVTALEKMDERRAGAAGIVVAVLKSPAIVWLIGAAVTVWALLKGKLP